MDRGLKWKLAVCALVSLGSLWLLAPTLHAMLNPEKAETPPAWMPPTAMRLGLDLQGGLHLTMGVDLDKVVETQLQSYGGNLEKALEQKQIAVKTEVKASGGIGSKNFELDIAPVDPSKKSAVSDYIGTDFTVLEVVGESGGVLVSRMARLQEQEVRTKAIDQSILTIRNRIDEFGVAEPIITRKGDSQILVQFPGAKEPERLKGLIGQTAQLNFQIVHECTQKDPGCIEKQAADLDAKIKAAETAGSYTRESFQKLSQYRDRVNQDLKAQLPADTVVAFERLNDPNVVQSIRLKPYLLSTKNILSGEYIQNAFVRMDRDRTRLGPERPVVSFEMNPAGGPLLAALTTEFQDHYMAIVLDGVVRSAPVIQNPITGGSGQITLGAAGSMDQIQKEARDTAIVLRAGALPASIELQEERVIGPSMGRDAISAGNRALVLAGVLIFVFMWVYYGAAGLVGAFVTLINVTVIFSMLGLVGATLTLPGIAGIVLTIGMAVDALIIIFERMREEIRLGRPERQVLELGFDKAFSAILDSNITTAMGGFVLLQFGTGSIRGFALTLIVGILVNVFMATFFAKSLMEWAYHLRQKGFDMGLSKKELQSIQGRA